MDFFSFEKEKAIESVLYIIKEAEYCQIHNIIELFYLSDINHLISFGRPITGIDYVKTEHGIDSLVLHQVFKGMIENNDLSITQKKISPKETLLSEQNIIAEREPDLMALSISDLNALNYVISCYNNGESLFKNKAWEDTKNNEIITLDIILDYIDDEYLTNFIYKRS